RLALPCYPQLPRWVPGLTRLLLLSMQFAVQPPRHSWGRRLGLSREGAQQWATESACQRVQRRWRPWLLRFLLASWRGGYALFHSWRCAEPFLLQFRGTW